jgi:hypothetical protein
MVYPSDDRCIRARLLAKQSREVCERLREQIERTRAAREQSADAARERTPREADTGKIPAQS